MKENKRQRKARAREEIAKRARAATPDVDHPERAAPFGLPRSAVQPTYAGLSQERGSSNAYPDGHLLGGRRAAPHRGSAFLLILGSLFALLFVFLLFADAPTTLVGRLGNSAPFLILSIFFFSWAWSAKRRLTSLTQIFAGGLLLLLWCVILGFSASEADFEVRLRSGGILLLIPGVVLALMGCRSLLRTRRVVQAILDAHARYRPINLDREANRLRMKESSMQTEYERAVEGGRLPSDIGAITDRDMVGELRTLCRAYAENREQAISYHEPLATQIGRELYKAGGLTEMRRVFAKVEGLPGARTLEMHWDGIGDWRG